MIPAGAMAARFENEADYFYLCPICGQPVDMRDLRQVMWHDRPVHDRLDIDARHHSSAIPAPGCGCDC
ncbi:MAG: hypothetical protein EOQ29_17475 [Mesorhizobium sp.]|nr:MAG: hypothetical protein EOQ29_17475 [Mesorhizobium sp.]